MVKETCMRLENDEVLAHMRTDPQLEEFRRERVQEILQDSFSFEQET